MFTGLPSVKISRSGTIELEETIACDGPTSKKHLFVSHAHSDHLGGVRKQVKSDGLVLATKETCDLASHLLGVDRKRGFVEIEYQKPFQIDESNITFFRANHILGAAQILLESPQGSVVYTGDFKQPGTPVIGADVLVIESTYGAPIYRRTPGEAEVALVETVVKLLKTGPVTVYAYAAKVQEAMSLLDGFVNTEFFLDDACYSVAKIYARHGYKLPRFHSLSNCSPEKSSQAVFFKSMRGSANHSSGSKVVLTGWAPTTVSPIEGGYMIRFSDHADFDQLIDYIRECSPKLVVTDSSRSGYAAILASYVNKKLGLKAKCMPVG
ncbi:MAG: MBL fold metallo-hydrolase [Candidatus Marsarchaeota archaeon]|nr:MBL fold metallo-hydrolase [Candidatus Marsarchaeota archaeon]